MKNLLHVLRAERHWSQAELAGRLRVSRQTVNAVETGKCDPSLPLAFRIARLFGRPIEEIFLCDLAAGGDAGPPQLRPLTHDRRFE
ncbi:MAG TPA: helix-turn-helix transcriptional regulator [Terriglobales bacterium]|jgi:putative transcriptional regulator|nr:helix-turn-helix transcriptional regulator [Terriglobales bacterium]